MNPQNMFALMGAYNTFQQNHPKFPAFLNALRAQGIQEDSIIEVSVTGPDGKKVETNLKVKASDLELFESLKNMRE